MRTEACIGCKACMGIGCPAISVRKNKRPSSTDAVRRLRRVHVALPESRRSAEKPVPFPKRNEQDMKSVMIVGVGGQGTLLASRLLGAPWSTRV